MGLTAVPDDHVATIDTTLEMTRRPPLRPLPLSPIRLIHWPSPGDAVPVADSMAALAEAQRQGLTTSIGVSNFTIRHMQEAIAAVGADAIATNQIEIHPYLPNRAVVVLMLMHYVDEGDGAPVLLLHGEPTWAYLYRKVIPEVAPVARWRST